MNIKELINRLERIELLSLEIKGRPAASAIAVHAQELIRELQQNAECLPRNLHPEPCKDEDVELTDEQMESYRRRKEIYLRLNPEPCNMDEDGVGCKPQDNDH